jgi:hypothetical protein
METSIQYEMPAILNSDCGLDRSETDRCRAGVCHGGLCDDAFFGRSELTPEYKLEGGDSFRKVLGAAYDLRSKYVHSGKPFGHWISHRLVSGSECTGLGRAGRGETIMTLPGETEATLQPSRVDRPVVENRQRALIFRHGPCRFPG